ncbi:hypothetical protein A3Q56_07047 [Intoshia linei]|uniref:K Homology domain-containing protein n=1 Tax=Intoshia linei TaxID=1819745 RepID=A0A177AUX7_9BILA|nr:hypothetical protein A3Q56_07047 [Intoshia linei]
MHQSVHQEKIYFPDSGPMFVHSLKRCEEFELEPKEFPQSFPDNENETNAKLKYLESDNILNIIYNSLNKDILNDKCRSNSENDEDSESMNTTERVAVPSSEHVAEIVGRQGEKFHIFDNLQILPKCSASINFFNCYDAHNNANLGSKIKSLRAKTNTYIKTPIRGDDPIFVVTGRKDDVKYACKEIQSAASHFTKIRANNGDVSRNADSENFSVLYKKNITSSAFSEPALNNLKDIYIKLKDSDHSKDYFKNSYIDKTKNCESISVKLRIPYRIVGLIVGPKGATIKRIQQKTQTFIVTPSPEREPVFELTGSKLNIKSAFDEIKEYVANPFDEIKEYVVNRTNAAVYYKSYVIPGSETVMYDLKQERDFEENILKIEDEDSVNTENSSNLNSKNTLKVNSLYNQIRKEKETKPIYNKYIEKCAISNIWNSKKRKLPERDIWSIEKTSKDIWTPGPTRSNSPWNKTEVEIWKSHIKPCHYCRSQKVSLNLNCHSFCNTCVQKSFNTFINRDSSCMVCPECKFSSKCDEKEFLISSFNSQSSGNPSNDSITPISFVSNSPPYKNDTMHFSDIMKLNIN